MRQISRRNTGWARDSRTRTLLVDSLICITCSFENNAFSVLHYVMVALHYSMLHRFKVSSAPGTIAHGSIGLFGHFRVTKTLTFKMRLGAQMSFICIRMKNHFHIKGWAPTLVLKQRPGGTRKWPRLPPCSLAFSRGCLLAIINMRNFIMFITAVCVLFSIIRISYDGPRTNVFTIHHIISILHCLIIL